MSKIKARHINLTDNFTFTGNVEVPTPFTGIQAATKDYIDSFDGFQGSKGQQGFTGTQGSRGFQGTQGTTGNTGVQGATGLQGSIGATGTQGASSAQIGNNIIINGGFDFWQRGTTNYLMSANTNSVGIDRWKILNGNGTLNISRQTTGTNFNHYYVTNFYKTVANGKHVFYHILEARDTFALRGKTVLFQAKLAVGGASPLVYRMAILEHTGTIDSVVYPAFSSVNTANGTDPTKGSNISNITVDSALNSTSANNGITGVSCTVPNASGAGGPFGLTVTVPSTAINLIFAIWPNDELIVEGTFQIGDVGAYVDASSLMNWNPKPYQQELEACQRYYEKSYNIETVPGSVTQNGCFQFIAVGTSEYKTINYKVTKRTATPQVTFYSSDGVQGTFRNIFVGTNPAATATGIGENNTSVSITSGISSSDLLRGHYTIDAEL